MDALEAKQLRTVRLHTPTDLMNRPGFAGGHLV